MIFPVAWNEANSSLDLANGVGQDKLSGVAAGVSLFVWDNCGPHHAWDFGDNSGTRGMEAGGFAAEHSASF
jgi:hypothetical protein